LDLYFDSIETYLLIRLLRSILINNTASDSMFSKARISLAAMDWT